MTDQLRTEADRREARRRQRKAEAYRPDPRMDRMRKMLDDDPVGFDALYGAKGHMLLGMHEAAREAAGEGPDEAA